MSMIVKVGKFPIKDIELFKKIATKHNLHFTETKTHLIGPFTLKINKETGDITIDTMYAREYRTKVLPMLTEYQKEYVKKMAIEHNTPIIYENENDEEITLVLEVQ